MNLGSFSDINVLVVGDLILDRYVCGAVSRISPESPVPILVKKQEWVTLGGCGNVANNIASLGGKVRVISCIGNDHYGSVLINMLEAINVDHSFLVRESDRVTSVKTRVISGNHQFIRIDEEEFRASSDSFIDGLCDNIDCVFDDVDLLIISDYGKGIVSKHLCQMMINESIDRSIPIIVDPKGRDWEKYRGATFCTPNLMELTEISGKDLRSNKGLIESTGDEIRVRYGIHNLLVTRSEDGLTIINDDGFKTFPVDKKEVVDVSGAGDTLVSTFALCYASKFDLGVCCRMSNSAASIVVSKRGTATVSPDELNLAECKSKVVSLEQATSIARLLHSQGKKLVFTNGCFDLLHPGHIKSLEESAELGDYLFVGLNSDNSVTKLKGPSRPIICEGDRAYMLESLNAVDFIIIFDDETPIRLIEGIKPDFLVKGSDYADKTIIGREFVESYGGKIHLIDLKEGYSTTKIIEKVGD